jgi:hypothetical protein
MAKVYRAARQGTIETQDASRFVFMLTAIARLIESSDIEKRLETVEQQFAQWRKESESHNV